MEFYTRVGKTSKQIDKVRYQYSTKQIDKR